MGNLERTIHENINPVIESCVSIKFTGFMERFINVDTVVFKLRLLTK